MGASTKIPPYTGIASLTIRISGKSLEWLKRDLGLEHSNTVQQNSVDLHL